MKEIGEEISDKNEFLEIAGGYDFNYVLKTTERAVLRKRSIRKPVSKWRYIPTGRAYSSTPAIF